MGACLAQSIIYRPRDLRVSWSTHTDVIGVIILDSPGGELESERAVHSLCPSRTTLDLLGTVSPLHVINVAVQSLSHVRLFLDPMDCSPPGSSVHGLSQARILEWATISFSRCRGFSQSRDWVHISCTGRWILYHWAPGEAPSPLHTNFKMGTFKDRNMPSCSAVLFKVLYCQIKMFSLFFVYYLCEKYYKPNTLHCYIADCVSWVPRLTLLDLGINWTYERALGTELLRM